MLLLVKLFAAPYEWWGHELEWGKTTEPDGESLTVTAKPAIDEISVRQMRFDRVPSEDPANVDCKKLKCSRTCLDLEFPIHISIDGKDESVPIFGEGGRVLLRYCPGSGSERQIDIECGATRACDGCKCPFEGNHEFHFSIARWRLENVKTELSPGRRLKFRGKGEATEMAGQYFRESNQDQFYDIDQAKAPRLGYRMAPLHCYYPVDVKEGEGTQRQQLIPVYQFEIPWAEGEGSDLTIEIPAIDGMNSVDQGWVCAQPND